MFSIKSPVNINIEDDEIFLKDLLKNFYCKIVDVDDFNTFDNTLIKWIKDMLEIHNKDPKEVFKMIQNYEKCQFWFTSLMGFFYQHGIGCDININLALELYLQTYNNKINDNSQLYLVILNIDDNLQDINVIISKYLLSLYYYKDIILIKRDVKKEFENIKKSAL